MHFKGSYYLHYLIFEYFHEAGINYSKAQRGELQAPRMFTQAQCAASPREPVARALRANQWRR